MGHRFGLSARLALAVLFALACGRLHAQNSSLGGTVLDPAGAVVQGAEITVLNLGTQAARVVESGAEGAYSVTNLPVGLYEITATRATFKSFHVPSVQLTVAQVLTVNITLEPGAVTEQVQVNGDLLPGVDLETSQVSNLVGQRQMVNLPLITRDPYSLILLSPGAMQTNTRLGGFSVNGASERNNNFLLDGLDNNDTSVPGGSGGPASLNPDATQEFRVITNNFMPEYGRNDGAIIDIVTKSGTNELHGDGYWFGRYSALGARDYFNHNLDDNGNIEPKNPYVRNLFGFSVGGPIIKDKTFFFFNAEWQRFRTTLTKTSIIPTAAFKSGVFEYQGNTVDLTSPSSLNNPQGLALDPTAQKILALYPDPNGPAVDDFRAQYRFPTRSAANERELTAKIDHRLSASESLSVRYIYDRFHDPNPFNSDFLPGLDASSSDSPTSNLSLHLTSILRPTLVNEAKFGFNRTDSSFGCGGLSTFDGVSGVDQFGNGRDYFLPGVDGFGCLNLGSLDNEYRRTGTWSAADNLSWVKNSHTMKLGGEYRRVFENGYDNFNSRDVLTFSGNSNFGTVFVDADSSTPCNNDPSDPGYGTGCEGSADLQDLGSFLFGIADSETQAQFFNHAGNREANDNREFRQNEYGVFFQDSWKVRHSLTLNLGVRYEFNSVPYEVNGNLSNLYVDPSGPAPFTFELAGPDQKHLLYNNDYSGIEPRVGFAWSPFGDEKTSVRGAFGMFHDRVFGNLIGNARGNPPFQQFYSQNPFDVPENLPFPGTLPSTPVVEDGAIFSPTLFDPHLRLPYTENWNFGIQHEIAHDLTLDLNYVGTRGVHLFRAVDGNPPDPALVQQLIDAGVAPSDLQFAALYVGEEFFGFPFNAVHNNAFAYGGAATLNRSIGNSIYNGLQANLTKRMSQGLQMQMAYTWSHSIDDAPDPIDPATNNRSIPRNSHAIQNERGNSDNDLRHRLVLNYVWEIPAGKGHRLAASGIGDKVLGGWQLSGITTFQSGHPYDVFYNVDVEHTGVSGRGTLIGDPTLPRGHERTQTGPLVSAFCVNELGCDPPLGVPGNVGRNRFNGPGINNWDMVLSKKIALNERMNLETRFEFYNLFNRVEFSQPDGSLADFNNFGVSSSTTTHSDGTTSARQVQFAMKLSF